VLFMNCCKYKVKWHVREGGWCVVARVVFVHHVVVQHLRNIFRTARQEVFADYSPDQYLPNMVKKCRYVLMTTVRPAMPVFFCAPAQMRPNFDTSTGRERKLEDMSAISGT
jgi:hypothetical protein